ncbi:hypothetical protein [Aeropyrum camini]|uniref:Uncharacterized protein n=1 Tax=Aeropyrum camini SY1 = JCM 12091 TaxID=1198449 RepID=U3TDT6_9CREN|nr:hypothetical protein [Aeropyrum camini]BAN90601.1 hypothetical protein ACAM_1132 [Aeropyrum camini SY1 = JCM 12091]
MEDKPSEASFRGESPLEEGVECGWVEAVERAYGLEVLIASAWTLLVSLVAAALGGPEAASLIVSLSLVTYLILSLFETRIRLAPLAAAAGAHLGAVASYYSNPLPLPFLVVERGPNGAIVNVDIVQLVAFTEIANLLLSAPACGREKDSKTPVEINSEIGPQAGAPELASAREPR